MKIHRTLINPQTPADLIVRLPERFLNTEIEVIAFSVEDEPAPKRKRTYEEAVKFWDAHAVDMSNFKFDREEANER
jgi:hypothetical protein